MPGILSRIGLCGRAKPVQNLSRGRGGRIGEPLREDGQEVWWRKTARLAAGTLAFCLAIAIVPTLTPEAFGPAVLGLTFGMFVFALAAPLGILAALFWFAGRQQAYDDRYDVTGD